MAPDTIAGPRDQDSYQHQHYQHRHQHQHSDMPPNQTWAAGPAHTTHLPSQITQHGSAYGHSYCSPDRHGDWGKGYTHSRHHHHHHTSSNSSQYTVLSYSYPDPMQPPVPAWEPNTGSPTSDAQPAPASVPARVGAPARADQPWSSIPPMPPLDALGSGGTMDRQAMIEQLLRRNAELLQRL